APDIFVAHADLTQLSADVVVVSTSTHWAGDGKLHPFFRRQYPGFQAQYETLAGQHRGRPDQVGSAHAVDVTGHGRVRAVVIAVAAGRTDPADHAGNNRLVIRRKN